MRGRITSDSQARNADGVLYKTLYESEKAKVARLNGQLIAALNAWNEADESKPNSKDKRAKLTRARWLTLVALSYRGARPLPEGEGSAAPDPVSSS